MKMNGIQNNQLDNLRLSFREICHYDKRLVFILFADVVVSAVMPFPNVIYSGKIVDSIASGNSFREVIHYVVLLFAVVFFLSVISIALSKSREYLFLKLMNKLDNEVNEKCLNIDYELFNDSAVQDRVLLINQAVRGNNFFTSLTKVFDTIAKIATLIGIVAIMSQLNMGLLFIATVVIVLQSILHYLRLKYDRKYKSDSVHDQRSIGYVSSLAKSIDIKKDIVTFDMGGFVLNKIRHFQKMMLKFEAKRIKVSGVIETLIYILSVAFQVSAYILIGYNAYIGRISIGEFTTGIASLISFMSASAYVVTNIVDFNDGFFYIKQYNAFRKFKSKYSDEGELGIEDIDLENICLEFRNVSFRYPNSTSYVLKNINIKIENKEKLGIVGFNGAGKTSFVLLLTRMYDPTEGQILLNGVDIKKIKYSDYQKIFSTVYQDYSLMAFTLLDNVALTDDVSDEDREQIQALFEKNGMGERLKKMYRGLDTPITKQLSASGIDLSGGERQKVAIIRALYKKVPVLILDEPTSALDPMAEMETYHKFSELSDKKTTVFISHRIYSTRFCDKIAVFNNGEIVEYGSYDELMKKEGLYYEFFQTQAENYR